MPKLLCILGAGEKSGIGTVDCSQTRFIAFESFILWVERQIIETNLSRPASGTLVHHSVFFPIIKLIYVQLGVCYFRCMIRIVGVT